MPKQLRNIFTAWELSRDEIMQGSMLSTIHKLVIQNQIAVLAETKLALKFTPNNLTDYTQQEAYLAGKIEMLQTLLLDSDEAEQLFAAAVRTDSQQADLEEANANHIGFLMPAVEGNSNT